jgi:hypothetical protein
MNKPFNNQYATQKLLSEESATGGGVSTGATFAPGTGEQYATTKAFKKKNEVKDKEPKLAAGKAQVYPQKKWGWKAAPSIPNRPSKGGFQYKQMFEEMEETIFEPGDRVKVVYGNEFYGETGTIDDIIKGFVTVEMDRDGKIYSMHSSDVERIEDEDDSEDFNEGTLQPVDTSKDSLSPMEYQQAQHYEKFDPAQWEFDDVSKRYIKRKSEAEKVMSEALTYNKFKREASTRQGKDAFHEALKSINKKLHEINKLMEYSSNMRTELEEDYSPRTGKVVNKLEKQLAEIYKKVKSLK